jgi:hypothetical protein
MKMSQIPPVRRVRAASTTNFQKPYFFFISVPFIVWGSHYKACNFCDFGKIRALVGAPILITLKSESIDLLEQLFQCTLGSFELLST